MAISRERKIFAGLFVVAIGGLAFDKAFLSQADAAAPAAPGLATASSPLAEVASAVQAKADIVIRDAMDRLLKEHIPDAMPDLAFGPAQAWIQPQDAPAIGIVSPATPGQVEPSSPAPTPSTPTLSLVMPTDTGGVATIDGVTLRVGQTHPDGYRLISVEARSVMIERNGSTAMLTLPSPGG